MDAIAFFRFMVRVEPGWGPGKSKEIDFSRIGGKLTKYIQNETNPNQKVIS